MHFVQVDFLWATMRYDYPCHISSIQQVVLFTFHQRNPTTWDFLPAPFRVFSKPSLGLWLKLGLRLKFWSSVHFVQCFQNKIWILETISSEFWLSCVYYIRVVGVFFCARSVILWRNWNVQYYFIVYQWSKDLAMGPKPSFGISPKCSNYKQFSITILSKRTKQSRNFIMNVLFWTTPLT